MFLFSRSRTNKPLFQGQVGGAGAGGWDVEGLVGGALGRARWAHSHHGAPPLGFRILIWKAECRPEAVRRGGRSKDQQRWSSRRGAGSLGCHSPRTPCGVTSLLREGPRRRSGGQAPWAPGTAWRPDSRPSLAGGGAVHPGGPGPGHGARAAAGHSPVPAPEAPASPVSEAATAGRGRGGVRGGCGGSRPGCESPPWPVGLLMLPPPG